VNAGGHVDCVDDLSTGRRENVDHLLKAGNFRFLNSDIAIFEAAAHYSFVFHLASHPSPDEYQKHPVESLDVNSAGTKNALELARRNDARFVFASTAEVYGDPHVVPTPESYWGYVNPTGPRSCYDEGKRFAEALCIAYYRAHGVDVRMPRIFNSYGPRLRADGLYGRALSRFIQQALQGEDVTVYGDGKQTRSFSYVTDTLRGIILCALRPDASGQVINVGNSEEITILELAERIISATGSGSKITFHPRPPDDPQRRCPDISKAKKLLGWVPTVSLQEGLARTIEWFSSRPEAGRRFG